MRELKMAGLVAAILVVLMCGVESKNSGGISTVYAHQKELRDGVFQIKGVEPIPFPQPLTESHQSDKERVEAPVSIKKESKPTEPIVYFTETKVLPYEQKENATWKYKVSKDEMYLLEKIVMAEAEGEPYEGKLAVANVVLNRLRSSNYPDTIHDVIYQKSQFSPVSNGRLKAVEPNEDCERAAKEAIQGIKAVPDDTLYFMNIKIATDQTVNKTKKKVKKIGQHTFFS